MAENWSLATIPELDDRQFQQWRELLERRVGMQLTEKRRSLLRSSLSIRMREIGCNDYQTYYNLIINGGKGIAEWSILVDRLTVHETRFFRDQGGFDLVANYLKEKKNIKSQFNIWSVGCATGEEPYSLAMVSNQILGDSIQYSVTATDISLPALAKAKEGYYNDRSIDVIPKSLREQSLNRNGNTYQIKSEIRDRVCFVKLNVMEMDRSPFSDFDIIYCQNLLIYFRKWRRKDIANHMAKRLSPGGIIILGSGEITDWNPEGLVRVQDEKSLAYIRPQQ